MKNLLLKKLYSILGETNKSQIRIINFHNILETEYEKFGNLIEYLKKNWRIISPEEFKLLIQKKKYNIDKKSILITFDDSYKSQKIVTEKYLDPLDIKALFFIVSDFVNIATKEEAHLFIKKNFFPNNDSIKLDNNTFNMSISDLKKLLNNGHTIGGHTKTHAKLSQIKDEKKLVNEIILSKKSLEKQLENYKIEDFAYTFGDVESIDKKSLHIILKNFTFLYSGLRGNNFNISSKVFRRDAVNLDESFDVISTYLNGYIDLIYNNKIKQLEKWAFLEN